MSHDNPKRTGGVSRDFLGQLGCPYCGERFESDSNSAGASVVCGILRCACHEYPVVEGIPILQQVDGLAQIVERIRANDPRGALLRALDAFRVQWAQRSRWHRARYYWNCSRLAAGRDIPFSEAAQLVRRPRVFADYLVHRYANPSFLAAIGPLTLLRRLSGAMDGGNGRGPRVLDLGCGAGHASHLMRLLCPGLHVISADQDFVNVYLARRYLVPDGNQLCLDAQVPSPFPDGYFDAVYCQDAFHYVRSKKSAVAELKRVSRQEAPWVFPHLHNKLHHNLVAGHPLSPKGYLACFDLARARLFPESDLLRSLTREGEMDLRRHYPIEELDKAPVLTLIKGGDEFWALHRDVPAVFREQSRSLRINPVFEVARQGDGVRLERRWPNPVMAAECAEAAEILPKSCFLGGSQWERLQAGESCSREFLDPLLMKFVLVPLPSSYRKAAWGRL